MAGFWNTVEYGRIPLSPQSRAVSPKILFMFRILPGIPGAYHDFPQRQHTHKQPNMNTQSRLGLNQTYGTPGPARVRGTPKAPPKREGKLWATVQVVTEHARSSLGQRLVKTGLKIGAFHPLLVGRTPRAFGFAETGTGFDTRS